LFSILISRLSLCSALIPFPYRDKGLSYLILLTSIDLVCRWIYFNLLASIGGELIASAMRSRFFCRLFW